jgi:hypothetical protein
VIWLQPKPLAPALDFNSGSIHPLGEGQSPKRKKKCLEPPQNNALIPGADKCMSRGWHGASKGL